MDDFDLLLACESLVVNAAETNMDDDIAAVDIERWQQLFGLSSQESARSIEKWRSDFGRKPITDTAWDMVKDRWPGFDKESYEFALATGKLSSGSGHQQSLSSSSSNPAARAGAGHMAATKYVVRLQGELADVEAIWRIAQLPNRPILFCGSDDDGLDADFCVVDGIYKGKILEYLLTSTAMMETPTFVRISEAEKALSSSSRYPTLGIDTTLPQFRLDSGVHDAHYSPSPTQDQFPVWYFFYGTLAEEDKLSRILHLDEKPRFYPAQVRRARLTSWAGKYKGLVDADLDALPVRGSAYLVKTREEEDALRCYETERYAVARCRIEFVDGGGDVADLGRAEVDGLAFRFLE